MKFVSALLSILYLGTLYLVRAEKRNIRGLSENTIIIEPDEVIVGTSPLDLEESVEVIDEFQDDTAIVSDADNEEITVEESTSESTSNRKLGTVTSFEGSVGKGATPAVVDETVVVLDYPKRPYGGPSKGGGSYYGGYGYGKGKGGR